MSLLTKSKFLNGLQCPRLLWFADKDKLPDISLHTQHLFNQGLEFEGYVKLLFKEGVDLGGLDFSENIEKTEELINQKKTIFQAGIKVDDFYCKVDILEFTDDGWNICEVKASSSVKKEHYPDLAFQKFVCEKAGLKVNGCFVYYLNNEFVKNGDIDPELLVLKEDVTENVNQETGISENAENFLKLIKEQTAPESSIGKHCNTPYNCPLKSDCWSYLPEYYVMQLTNWRVYWKLFEDGILDIKDIPDGTKLNSNELIIKEAVIKNKTFIAKDKIKSFLDSLNYPLNYLDFETFDTAVPIFDSSRPWQKIPFQFSLHIQDKNGNIEHREFLADGNGDPRPKLLDSLRKSIPETGDVIVFHRSFEESRLNELARDFPEHNDWIQNVLSRVVDLMEPFKNFHYYNPVQKGSKSIKDVLPAVTGKDYSSLAISSGDDASAQYFYSHIKDEISDKVKIRENLLKYCGLDTEGMIWIVDELKNLCN